MEKCYLLQETQLHQIIHQANKLLPDFIVLDSIQTIQSENLDSAPEVLLKFENVHLKLYNMLRQPTLPF